MSTTSRNERKEENFPFTAFPHDSCAFLKNQCWNLATSQNVELVMDHSSQGRPDCYGGHTTIGWWVSLARCVSRSGLTHQFTDSTRDLNWWFSPTTLLSTPLHQPPGLKPLMREKSMDEKAKYLMVFYKSKCFLASWEPAPWMDPSVDHQKAGCCGSTHHPEPPTGKVTAFPHFS